MWELLALYLAFMLLSLTGALSPGPLTSMAITEGARAGRWAGTRLAVGHALIEVPAVFAIAYGLGTWLAHPLVRGIFGVIGAGVLLWMGSGLMAGAWQGRLRLGSPVVGEAGTRQDRGLSQVAGGAMLTLTNPYWSFWWVTIGAGRITDVAALRLGPLAIAGLVMTHWLTDLGWLGGLSFVMASGRGLIGDRVYRGILLVCGAFLVAFGVYMGWNGLRFLGAVP